MSGQEARINDALRQVGEEFRLGMIKADEYRARRRLILESWGERDSTTSPGSRRSMTTPAAGSARPAGVSLVRPPEPKTSGVPVAAVLGALALAAGAYFVLKPNPAAQPGQPGQPAVRAPAPQSPALIAIKKAADEFVAANVWEAGAIDAFLARWRPLSAVDRAQAMGDPAMRTLRYKLDQNIQAESQLVAPDAPPEERARLTQLQDFAHALDGSGQ